MIDRNTPERDLQRIAIDPLETQTRRVAAQRELSRRVVETANAQADAAVHTWARGMDRSGRLA